MSKRRADLQTAKPTSLDLATKGLKQTPSPLAACRLSFLLFLSFPSSSEERKEKEIAPSPNQPSLKQYHCSLKKKKKNSAVAESLQVVRLAAPPFPQYYPPQEEKDGKHTDSNTLILRTATPQVWRFKRNEPCKGGPLRRFRRANRSTAAGALGSQTRERKPGPRARATAGAWPGERRPERTCGADRPGGLTWPRWLRQPPPLSLPPAPSSSFAPLLRPRSPRVAPAAGVRAADSSARSCGPATGALAAAAASARSFSLRAASLPVQSERKWRRVPRSESKNPKSSIQRSASRPLHLSPPSSPPPPPPPPPSASSSRLLSPRLPRRFSSSCSSSCSPCARLRRRRRCVSPPPPALDAPQPAPGVRVGFLRPPSCFLLPGAASFKEDSLATNSNSAAPSTPPVLLFSSPKKSEAHSRVTTETEAGGGEGVEGRGRGGEGGPLFCKETRPARSQGLRGAWLNPA